jgi:hypothetical protein
VAIKASPIKVFGIKRPWQLKLSHNANCKGILCRIDLIDRG